MKSCCKFIAEANAERILKIGQYYICQSYAHILEVTAVKFGVRVRAWNAPRRIFAIVKIA